MPPERPSTWVSPVPYEPLRGWVEFRSEDPARTKTTAHFHVTTSCPRFRVPPTARGPMILGEAERYRGLEACTCVPDRGVHPTHWISQGYTFLYG